MRPHECPHKGAKLQEKHRLLSVTTRVDRFSLSRCKTPPIYHSIPTHHNASDSARILREQEVRSSNLRAPTNSFNNLHTLPLLPGSQNRPKMLRLRMHRLLVVAGLARVIFPLQPHRPRTTSSPSAEWRVERTIPNEKPIGGRRLGFPGSTSTKPHPPRLPKPQPQTKNSQLCVSSSAKTCETSMSP